MYKPKLKTALVGAAALTASLGLGGTVVAQANTGSPAPSHSAVQSDNPNGAEESSKGAEDGPDVGPDANPNEPGHQDADESGDAADTGSNSGPDANPNEAGHQDADESGEAGN